MENTTNVYNTKDSFSEQKEIKLKEEKAFKKYKRLGLRIFVITVLILIISIITENNSLKGYILGLALIGFAITCLMFSLAFFQKINQGSQIERNKMLITYFCFAFLSGIFIISGLLVFYFKI